MGGNLSAPPQLPQPQLLPSIVQAKSAGGSIQIDVRPIMNSTGTMTLTIGTGGKTSNEPGGDTTLKLCDGTVVTASGGGKSVASFNVNRSDYPDWDKYGKGGEANQPGVDGFGAINVFSLYVVLKDGRTAATEGFTNLRWGNRFTESMALNGNCWVDCPNGICPNYGTTAMTMNTNDKFKGCPYDKLYEENGEQRCACPEPPPQTQPPARGPSSSTSGCWIHCPGNVCPTGISTSVDDPKKGCHPDNIYYENDVQMCRCSGPSNYNNPPPVPPANARITINNDNHCWTQCPGGACPPGILRSSVDRLYGCPVGKAYFEGNIQYCDCTKNTMVKSNLSVQECINNTQMGTSGSCDQCVSGFYGDATSSGCKLPVEDVTIVRIENIVVGKTSLNQNNATVDGFTVDITLEINARNYLYGMVKLNNSVQSLLESRRPSDTVKSVVTFRNIHITESGMEWTVLYYDTNTSNAPTTVHNYALKYRATSSTNPSISCKIGDFAVGYILIGGGQAGIIQSSSNPVPESSNVEFSQALSRVRLLYDTLPGCVDCPNTGCPVGYVVSADDPYKGYPYDKQVPGGKCRGPLSTWQNCPRPLVGGVCTSCSEPYPNVGKDENSTKCRGGGKSDTDYCINEVNGKCPDGTEPAYDNPITHKCNPIGHATYCPDYCYDEINGECKYGSVPSLNYATSHKCNPANHVINC